MQLKVPIGGFMVSLSQLDIFSRLPLEALDQLKQMMTRQRYKTGELLFNEGDEADALYLIQRGRVKVFVSQQEKEFILSIQGRGEAVGELSILDDQPRSASVEAIESCDVLILPKSDFKEWLVAQPQIGLSVIAELVGIIRRQTEQIRGLALQDVYSRVRAVLEGMAGQPDTDGLRYIADRLTQQDIADRVGSSREMIARILKELVLGEYISIENRHVTLLKNLPDRF